ncbi:hypothetical protein ENH_00022370 [Eimeria necatrix]|uniref:Transmembrane protein n=1 Tax=Eimeria necatrix TaxID=51315 RepID=U6MRG0_9EIME|nr:hypothetical protein ENH_00022370 [Eimeria necatrix]CDJ66586.1 hypothetical protein ENH_00022370 [Eimeria necatrix]
MNSQYRNDLSSFRTTDQTVGSISFLQRKTEHSSFDDKFQIQSPSKKKLFSSPWTRHLGVAITFLAAAYLLLVCFHFIEARKLSAPQIRSLADRHDGSCDWDSAADDGDDRSRQGRGQQLSEEGLSLSQHEAHGAHKAEASGPGEVDVVASTGEGATGNRFANWTQQLAQSSVKSWAKRNLPPAVKERLVDVFSRMVRAARLCQSLLPKLTCEQRLQLTYRLMRLMALDLGAISLVREDMEPARQSVGDSLISLGLECLGSSGSDAKLEGVRSSLRQLIGLVDKLKQPRHVQRECGHLSYKIKMVAIMSTAGLILKNCLVILDSLLRQSNIQQSAIPEALVEQKLSVLKELYRVHAGHIAVDKHLMEHILRCQEATGVYALLLNRQAVMPKAPFPKLQHLQDQIRRVVNGKVRFTPFEQQNPIQSERSSYMFVGSSQSTTTRPETFLEHLGSMVLHKGSAEEPGRDFNSAAFSSSEYMHGGTPFPSPAVPQLSAIELPHQGAEPAAQPLPQLESRPLGHQPDWVLLNTLGNSPSSWLFWLDAVHQPSQRPERQIAWGSSSTGSSFLPFAPQSAEAGFSVGQIKRPAPTGRYSELFLASTMQLLQRTQVESSARLQSPAAGPHTSDYSLFGQGGVPPWSPFSLVPAASVEEQATAGRGWVDAQLQDMRDPSTEDLEESSGRLEFGHQ